MSKEQYPADKIWPKLNHALSSYVYPTDDAVPLMEFRTYPKRIAQAVMDKTIKLEEVQAFFKRAADAVQEAIKEGKSNVST